MPYAFPSDLANLVSHEMSVGGYVSEEDVLRDALAALAERRSVLDDIRAGIADMETGRGRPLTDVDTDMRRKYNIPLRNESSHHSRAARGAATLGTRIRQPTLR